MVRISELGGPRGSDLGAAEWTSWFRSSNINYLVIWISALVYLLIPHLGHPPRCSDRFLYPGSGSQRGQILTLVMSGLLHKILCRNEERERERMDGAQLTAQIVLVDKVHSNRINHREEGAGR